MLGSVGGNPIKTDRACKQGSACKPLHNDPWSTTTKSPPDFSTTSSPRCRCAGDGWQTRCVTIWESDLVVPSARSGRRFLASRAEGSIGANCADAFILTAVKSGLDPLTGQFGDLRRAVTADPGVHAHRIPNRAAEQGMDGQARRLGGDTSSARAGGSPSRSSASSTSGLDGTWRRCSPAPSSTPVRRSFAETRPAPVLTASDAAPGRGSGG